MSTLLELDYIGLSDASSSMEKLASQKHSNFNLKETELRLGLPGSMSPDRNPQLGFPLFDDKTTNGYSVLKNSSVSGAKRGFSDTSIKWGLSVTGGSEVDMKKSSDFSPAMKDGGAVKEKKSPQVASGNDHGSVPAAKAQVVGWPPIRSFRKNSMATSSAKNSDDAEAKLGVGCLYVKVSMDGAPYLRKVDLKIYTNYKDLSSALEKMFSCFTIGQCGSHGISESRLMDLLHGSEYVLTYEDKDGDWMLVGDVPWNMFTNSCRRMRIMKGSEAIGLAPRAMEKCKTRN